MNQKYSDKTKEKVTKQYLASVSVSDYVSKFNVLKAIVYTWINENQKTDRYGLSFFN